MKRLSSGLTKAVKDIKPILKDFDGKTGYSDTHKMYQKINKVFIKHKCDVYDINQMVQTYKANTDNGTTVKVLKRFMRHRNKLVLTKACKSSKWKPFIDGQKRDIVKETRTPVKTEDVIRGVSKVLRKYNNNWLGYWSVITLNESGKIDDIKMFDATEHNTVVDCAVSKKK